LAQSAAAATINVPSGGDLQAAINAAQPGDTILLQAGATWTGNYKLPVKSGTATITIRSSAADSSLPAAGVRISPSYAGSLAKIRSNANGAALRTSGAASNWRLMFLEFLPSVSNSSANLLELGAAGSSQTTLASVPQHLVVDRCYFHGNATYGQRRGIALNSGDTQILNSYFSDFKGVNQDTQAIEGWNGPGPYLIENNYLEAAGENILFGGSDPSIPNLVPSNIEIRRNLISRPLAWMSQSWTVKNVVEFKNAENVTVEGNTIQNNWAAGQQGYSIMFTPRNQGGTAPWTVVKNITVQNNVIRHVAAVFDILGYDNLATSEQTSNIVIRNNLVYDVSTAYGTSSNPANGWFAIIGGGPKDITFDHNTVDNNGSDTIFFYAGYSLTGTQIAGFVLKNNMLRDNKYGVFGDTAGEGTAAFKRYTPSAYVQANDIGGANASAYPTGNDYPTLATWIAGFVSESGANYTLTSSNIARGAGTDGKDIGVDFTELNAALAGSTTTSTASDPPPSTPTATSTPFTGTPIALPGRIEAENYDKGGEKVAYVDTTPGNSGGVYRTDDVDIRQTTDSSGGYNLKSVRATEWLNYTVDIAAAGTYAVTLRVASSGTGGTVHLAVDGSNVSGSIALPDTGGWDTWRTTAPVDVALPSGKHIVRLAIDANGSGGTAADINWIDVATTGGSTTTTTSGSTPYTGTAVAVPGVVQFENYDAGGEGVGYHDTTAGNTGGVYRFNNVDIQATSDTGGGYNIGWVAAGEWLNYTVKVGSSGTYSIDVRVASSGAGGTFHIDVDGSNVTGSMAVPSTGGWQTWKTITKTGVALASGLHVIRVVMDTAGSGGSVGNFNWFSIH
jgi:hypothetical protein